ncbi:MAG: hypothetical protein ABI645_00400 [Pseudomonadota bacterium]
MKEHSNMAITIRWSLAACGVFLALCAAAAEPTATQVVVRVQAHDAKFIGSGVGEMNIREAMTLAVSRTRDHKL